MRILTYFCLLAASHERFVLLGESAYFKLMTNTRSMFNNKRLEVDARVHLDLLVTTILRRLQQPAKTSLPIPKPDGSG
jgi:hypothetical protein